MGVLLQGFYKMLPNSAVPSPADGNASVPWWWDHIAAQASDLRKAGFTAVWLPPVLKASSGSTPGSDGYGPFDDYDIGSKDQAGSGAKRTFPTRFGTREQLQRCVAVARANGLDVYLDMVEHQRSGDPGNFIFRYLGANGIPQIGRFPKNPLNFRSNVPEDPHLGGPISDDIPFGRELEPINAIPKNYVFDNLIDAADWLTRALDVQGYRIDDVKGISTDFLRPFLNSKSMAGKFAVGEFFDGNRVLVNGWIFNPRGMQGRPSAFDFPMRFVIEAMCSNAGNFNMADLDHVGLTGISPQNSVTFVENHDTDLGSGRIAFNKMLGYALILTSEGYPCVYYRDYSTDANCFGLKPGIDNLIWIHENLAAGPTQQRWKDFDVFAYERLGGDHLLTALNNDPRNSHTITVDTGFGPNVRLHEYTGNSGDVTTNGGGRATITIPRNDNGKGYVCYSRSGITADFPVTIHRTTQEYEGAADLDIPPASPQETVVARIWARAGTDINVSFRTNSALPATETITVTVSAGEKTGLAVGTKDFTSTTLSGDTLAATAAASADGWHRVAIRTSTLAALPFVVGISYEAQQTL